MGRYSSQVKSLFNHRSVCSKQFTFVEVVKLLSIYIIEETQLSVAFYTP